MSEKKVSEKQAAHLEKAREVRNEHQGLLTEIKKLEAELERHKAVGTVFHDEGLSFTRYNHQVLSLKNTWPELYAKLAELHGPIDR